ncbi:MAG: phosphatidylserine decarboxylase family protein [Planctomycetota bacterium]|nr:phosphatidylserine decarboxylase family protein [Planctomycetota bacterium]
MHPLSLENRESAAHSAGPPTDAEPLPADVDSIQPGGGFCMSLELGWGYGRRWWLKTFRRGYVARMAALRRGEPTGCPHDVLDSRDLKFYHNQSGCHWDPADDPFTWRDRLPLARAGFAELLIIGGGFAVLTMIAAWLFWPACFIPALLGLFVISFFRDPSRNVPSGEGLVVAPADGKVVAIERLPHDEFVGGPAVMVGIFLSVFNVHLNRTPVAARIVGLRYRRGKFLNALRPESARENEQMAIRLVETSPPYRRLVVRQIAGAIARRIVCWVAPGECLERGAKVGMIKLGSRTELVLPETPGLVLHVKLGDHVRAGSSVVARYENISDPPEKSHVTTQGTSGSA